jgi:hypothetical protein
MSDVPLNRVPLNPTENIAISGDLFREVTPLGIGGVFTSRAIDVSAFPEIRLRSLSNAGSAIGGVVMWWSLDGVVVAPGVPAFYVGTAVGGTILDSGVIARAYNYVIVIYTNGGFGQASFRLALEGYQGFGGGGGGGAVTVTADMEADPQSKTGADPSTVLGTTPVHLQVDPDRRLRNRSMVSTDETAFSDDFARPGATIYRTLTGLWTIAAGGIAAIGAGGAALTEVRKGDYFQIHTDDSLTVPKWAQVASVGGNNTINLVATYTGVGGAGVVADISPWGILVSDAGGAIGVANSIAGLAPGLANGSMVMLYRALSTVGTFKSGLPFRLRFRADTDNRRANQHIAIQVTDSAGIQIAKVEFEGVDDTQVALRTGGSNATTSQLAVSGTLPPPLGTSASMHTYEALFLQHIAVLTCDGQVMATCPYHLPDAYFWSYTATSFMMLTVSIQNGAAMGGATVLAVDEVGVENLDTVQVEAYSLDATKFNVTALAGGSPMVLDAGNSSVVALTGSGGLTPTFTGVTVDMLNYPAALLSLIYTKAADTDFKNVELDVIWSPTAVPGAGVNRVDKCFVSRQGNGAQGALLVNRKNRYMTVLVTNNSVDALATMILTAYKLGTPVQEFNSSATDGPGASASTAINTDLVTNLTTGAGWRVNLRYRLTVKGGAGFCIRVNGTDPTVADEPWENDMKLTFTLKYGGGNPVRAIKRTAGSADGAIIVTTLDDNGA